MFAMLIANKPLLEIAHSIVSYHYNMSKEIVHNNLGGVYMRPDMKLIPP